MRAVMKPNIICPPLKAFINAAKEIRKSADGLHNAKIVLDTSILNTNINNAAKRLIKNENVYISEDTFYELQLLAQFPSGLFYKKAMEILSLEYGRNILIDSKLNTILTNDQKNLNEYIFIVPNRLRAVEYMESIFYSERSVIIYPDINGKDLLYTTLKNDLDSRKSVIKSIKVSFGDINNTHSSIIEHSVNDDIRINGFKYQFYNKGGEGTLYKRNNTILKLYNRQITPLKQNKIEHIIDEGTKISTANNYIIFPQSIVTHKSSYGYTMEKVNGVTITEALRNKTYLNVLSDNVEDIFKKILYVVLEMNIRGIVLSDISTDNILIDKYGNIFFCDMDSVQIAYKNKFFASGCYRPKASSHKIAKLYEKYPQRLPSYIRTQDTDAFSLVVLLYEMYMGCAPLHAQGELGTANFYKNHFPLNANTTTCIGVPHSVFERWKSLDNVTKGFFTNTFSGKLKPGIGTIVRTILAN